VTYPSWSYYPKNTQAPPWVEQVLSAVGAQEGSISTEQSATGLSSDAVLRLLAPALQLAGFAVESGKARMGKIVRPVLFGENGKARVSYEVDGFHEGHGIVLEVEAGRGARGNAEYRDLLRSSLILDAHFLVLMLPQVYRFKSGSGVGAEHAYKNTVGLLDAVYASQRLIFPFKGLLLVGY
jgi:hypothetical protein